MGFDDAIKGFVSNVAASASAAKDKLQDGATIMRLETEVKQLQNQIDKCCDEIGRQYAAKYAGDYGGEFGAYLEQISKAKDRIRSIEAEISAIRGTRKCSNCGANIDIDAAFCVKCGMKQAPAQTSRVR